MLGCTILMALFACQEPPIYPITDSTTAQQAACKNGSCDSWDEPLSLFGASLADIIIDGQRRIYVDLTVNRQDEGATGFNLELELDSTVSSSNIELSFSGSWLGSDPELSSSFDFDEDSHVLSINASRWDCIGKNGTGSIVTVLIDDYDENNPLQETQLTGNGIVIMIDDIGA